MLTSRCNEMTNHKVFRANDCKSFIETKAFHKLCSVFKTFKESKGHFVLVLATPGTGKSANMHQALSLLDINMHDAKLFIDADSKPGDVFNIFWDTLKEDMDVKTKEEAYKKASEYDLVLFADSFLDSEHINPKKMGLGLWTEENGPSTFPLYFKVLYEYLKHYRDLKKINIVAQTSWVIKFRGIRYDILTDLNLFSKILVFILKRLFEVVIISYTKEEMIKIIKNHSPGISEEKIEEYLNKYGNRPRFIFDAIEKEENNQKRKQFKKYKTNQNSISLQYMPSFLLSSTLYLFNHIFEYFHLI